MVNTRKRMFAFLCAVILALAASPVYGLQTGAGTQSASAGDLEASFVTVTKRVAGSVNDGYTVSVEITAADPAEDADAENSSQADSTAESVTLNLQADLLNRDTVLKEVIAKEFDAENAEISAEAFVPGEDGPTVDKENAPTAEKNGQTFSVSGFDYSSLLPVAEETAAPVQKLLVTISGLQYSGEPADSDQNVAVDTEVSGFYKDTDAEEAAQALPVSEAVIPASLQENGSISETKETEAVSAEEISADEETDVVVSKDADLLKDGNLAKSLVVDQLMSAADPALTSTLLGANGSGTTSDTITLAVGETKTFEPTGLAEKQKNATETFKWTILSGEDKISVSNTTEKEVEITGEEPGTAELELVHIYKKNGGSEIKKYQVEVTGSSLSESSIGLSSSSIKVAVDAAEIVTVTTSDCTVTNVASSNADVANASLSDDTITITGIAEGTATVVVSGTPSEGYSEPESQTIVVTVTEPKGDFTESESTAQQSDSTDPSVTVKDTGQWKKLSDYHVVVVGKSTEYQDEKDFLAAYDIHLADQNGDEVDASELKNGGKNLNLQVTLTYNELPKWFDEAASSKKIKHYKSSSDRTELDINNIKFDKNAKTISFIVHGFSDFVLLKGGSSSDGTPAVSTGDGVRVRKWAEITDTENEFLVHLEIDYTIVRSTYDTFLDQSAKAVWGSSSNFGKNKAKEDMDNGDLTDQIHGQPKKDGDHKYTVYLYYNKKLIGSFTKGCEVSNPSLYLYIGKDDKNEDQWICIACKDDWASDASYSVHLSEDAYEALKTHVEESVSTALVNVTDTMGPAIIFQGVQSVNDKKDYTDADGTVTPANAATTTGTTITWTPKINSGVEGTSETTVVDGVSTTTTWYNNAATLIYKVKLDTSNTSFINGKTQIANYYPLVENNLTNPDQQSLGLNAVNSSAELTYNTNDTIKFPVPYVRGQKNTYTLTYDKNTTEEVSGMPEKEEVEDAGTSHQFTLSDGTPNRPGYIFKGWAADASGKLKITQAEATKDQPNITVYAIWEEAPITGLTLDSPQGALGAGSAVALLSVGFWFLRRRILHP